MAKILLVDDEPVERFGLEDVRLDPALVARLRAHDWPGNVRELENTEAARRLGMTRVTLIDKMKRHGLFPYPRRRGED